MIAYQGQKHRKGYCDKCYQPGEWKYVTKVNTSRPVKYYKCTNPKCNFTWSETA